MSKETPKVDLNIYLLKESIKDHRQAINNISKLKEETIDMGGKPLGVLYVKRSYANKPRWANFFSGHLDASVFGKNTSTGALFIVQAEGRYFALSFGQGRHSLDTQYVETNFGLMVALNCVDQSSLRSIDKASFETQPRQSREQAGRATDVQDFGLDVERDLLRAVTGKPTDRYFGERISGMDSVKLGIEVELTEVKSLLRRLLVEYKSTAYRKKGFAFVDHIREVKDQALLGELDEQLIAKISGGELEKIWMAVPELVNWDTAVGFKYSLGIDSPRVYDVRVSDFLKHVGDVQLSKDLLLRRKVYCVDAEDEPLFQRPAYYFLYAEISIGDKTYLLNNGKWYAIDGDFVEQINDYYSSIPRYAKPLPAYELADKSEGHYNKRVADNDPAEFALLDKKNVSVTAAVSPVEPCDLYRASKEFIHVKRYGGSSLFSHLFNQGLVSGELFKRERRFRELVNDKLPGSHKLADAAVVPQPDEYKVIYAIISESDDELSIPFFSRISLRHAAQRLTGMGYPVEIAKIAVTQQSKQLKVYAAKHPKLRKPRKEAVEV